jgi:hypothetical protein
MIFQRAVLTFILSGRAITINVLIWKVSVNVVSVTGSFGLS